MLAGSNESWSPYLQQGIDEGRLFSAGPGSYVLADQNLWGNHPEIVNAVRNIQYVDGFQFFSNGTWEDYQYWEEAGYTFFEDKTIVRNISEYENNVDYRINSIRLDRPRDYWVALPNEVNLSGKDFEIVVFLNLDSVPKGHETLFSQSSIFRLNEEFNDQSWKWSIIDGRMYFFWIEEVISGYANFVGGQSLRSGKLISTDGNFDSIISNFSLSQYDEITTSHNGFLTMSVEYGLFITLLILFFIIYLILKNYNKENEIEVALLFMLLTQNLTNDLIYAPDVAIYFWIIPFYFLANILEN